MVIDAHVHLWDRQHGRVNGRPVVALKGGRSDFGGALRQMMPPLSSENSANPLMLIRSVRIPFTPYRMIISARAFCVKRWDILPDNYT